MYNIDPEVHNQILTYLGEIPAKYANPLITFLSNLKDKIEIKPEVKDSK